MNDLPKGWYASKTIWASILTTIWPLFLVLAKQFNIPLPDADSTAALLATVGTIVAAAVAIWGRVNASAPIAKPSTPAVKALTVFLIVPALGLAGCTSAQVASTVATVSKYQADVAAACSIAEGIATGPLAAIPVVSSAAALIHSGCDTEEAIASLALSPTSVAWLGTLVTTIKSKGAVVLPAPVAPEPATAATVIPSVAVSP